MNNNEQIDELVAMLDGLMDEGKGHINVTFGEGEGMKVETTSTSDCGTNMACCQPTEKSPEDEQ